jgi:nifR3 family TIM-barrel protein
VSEFISAEGLTRDNARTKQMLTFSEAERPVAIQIYGGDPDRMDDAAAIVEAQGVDIVDVNMGCPVRKIVNTGAGSGLLKDFDRAARVVEKIRKRVKIPLTVKVRKGWESDDVLPLLKRFEEIGVAAIAIHGRTRNEAYTGASDWDYIAHVKSELRIPVWGNGDVKNAADARHMFERTGVDGVMIGRAALHNPFIFRDILNVGPALSRSEPAGEPALREPAGEPALRELDRRIEAMQRYLHKIDRAPQPDKWKLHKARTVIGWFSKGIAHGKDIRSGLAAITSVADVQNLLDQARDRLAA